MFDLSRLRTLNLDALRPWRIYTLRQTLVTRDGQIVHPSLVQSPSPDQN